MLAPQDMYPGLPCSSSPPEKLWATPLVSIASSTSPVQGTEHAGASLVPRSLLLDFEDGTLYLILHTLGRFSLEGLGFTSQ